MKLYISNDFNKLKVNCSNIRYKHSGVVSPLPPKTVHKENLTH